MGAEAHLVFRFLVFELAALGGGAAFVEFEALGDIASELEAGWFVAGGYLFDGLTKMGKEFQGFAAVFVGEGGHKNSLSSVNDLNLMVST